MNVDAHEAGMPVHPDRDAITKAVEAEALVKRLRAEEARMVRLYDLVVTKRDAALNPEAFATLNNIKHAISGRDPVFEDAAAFIVREILMVRERDKELTQLREDFRTLAAMYKLETGDHGS